VLTSWQVVLANPIPMAILGRPDHAVYPAGLGSLFLGLIPVIPMLGHASWHAYRDLVDASKLPAREPAP